MLLLAVAVVAVAVAGCSNTAEDLDRYLFGPGGMEAVLAEEARVIGQFNDRVNQDRDSEDRSKEVARLLREQVLPAYASVLGRMKGVPVENKKIQKLHGVYLEITSRQQQVFEELLALLESEEYGGLPQVNLHLAQLRNRRTDWEQELRRLCAKYEVTYRRE